MSGRLSGLKDAIKAEREPLKKAPASTVDDKHSGEGTDREASRCGLFQSGACPDAERDGERP
jgi:hypothetical protein